jgi:molybdopterin-guanine dinucleotide biosynthesis protein A
MSVTGLILAGGLGRRMGGADKGLVPYQGRPLVAHVRDALAPQVDGMMVSANRNEEIYRTIVPDVLPDRIPGFAGPLAGLHAGLCAARTELVVSVPCDSPHVPPDLVPRLREAMDVSGSDVVIAVAGGREQPAHCLCRRALADRLGDYLTRGGRRMLEWVRSENWTSVAFDDAAGFANVNRPEDLDRS